MEWTTDTVLAHHAVYACITRIAQDIGKLRPKLVERDDDGIWSETENAAHSPALRKPEPIPEPYPVQGIVGDLEAHARQHLRAHRA
jgi:phage portal protein BeeE